MSYLTKNLSRHEFACKCGCGFDTVDFELVTKLQSLVYIFIGLENDDIKIIITGGNRCKEYNEEVQRKYNPDYVAYSSRTQHMYAKAADFKLYNRRTGEQISSDRVADYLDKLYAGRFGIGRYSNRTHFDVRSGNKARW